MPENLCPLDFQAAVQSVKKSYIWAPLRFIIIVDYGSGIYINGELYECHSQ